MHPHSDLSGALQMLLSEASSHIAVLGEVRGGNVGGSQPDPNLISNPGAHVIMLSRSLSLTP